MRWEYKTLRCDENDLGNHVIDHVLSDHGAAGWELVSVVTKERHGYSHGVWLFLKRRISASTPFEHSATEAERK